MTRQSLVKTDSIWHCMVLVFTLFSLTFLPLRFYLQRFPAAKSLRVFYSTLKAWYTSITSHTLLTVILAIFLYHRLIDARNLYFRRTVSRNCYIAWFYCFARRTRPLIMPVRSSVLKLYIASVFLYVCLRYVSVHKHARAYTHHQSIGAAGETAGSMIPSYDNRKANSQTNLNLLSPYSVIIFLWQKLLRD